jgi:hypothetical protein
LILRLWNLVATVDLNAGVVAHMTDPSTYPVGTESGNAPVTIELKPLLDRAAQAGGRFVRGHDWQVLAGCIRAKP